MLQSEAMTWSALYFKKRDQALWLAGFLGLSVS